MDIVEITLQVLIFMIPFLFALCFHEYAHGLVAKRLGDNTASIMGRLTLNPMAHADPIGTFVLPIASVLLNSPLFFGWAKPVPVNERNLKNPKRDMFWVAAAGPLSNLLLAFVGTLLMAFAIKYLADMGQRKFMVTFCTQFISINLFLAVFNLIPVHPLDGGKVLARFLPDHLNEQLEANQHVSSMVLMFLLLSGVLKVLAYPVYWAQENLMILVDKLV